MSGKAFKAMSGTLQVKANHKWTSYDFKTCGVYFHYFGAKVQEHWRQGTCLYVCTCAIVVQGSGRVVQGADQGGEADRQTTQRRR